MKRLGRLAKPGRRGARASAERVKRERVRPETLVGVLVLVFVSTDNLPDLALRRAAAPSP